MAVKEASVRLDLKPSGFRRGMRKATSDVKRGAKQMGGALKSSMSAGAKGGIDAVKGLFSTIKSGIGQIGALVGGIGFGALLKGAVDADEKFRKLAFTVSAGTGAFVEARDLQLQAQKSAQRWGVANEDLAESLEEVFNTVGDLQFSRAVLDDIAKAARASGQPVQLLAKLVAEANRQFGITAEQAPAALADILSQASKGGLSVADLGAQMGILGSLASQAGLKGGQGLNTMLGLVNTISAASGRSRTAVSDLNTALATLQDAATATRVEKALKIDLSEAGDSLSRLEAVLRATRGEAGGLTQVFGADLGVTVARAFGEPFAKALEGATGTEQEKLDTAVNAFRLNMAKAAKSALTAADVTKQAEKNRKSAQAQINIGLEKLKAAFTKPEIVDGITKLAELIPKFADVISSIVDFAAKNPLLTGAGVVAGVGAKGAIGAAIAQAFAGRAIAGAAAGAVPGAAAGGVPVTGASGAGKAFAATAFAGVAVAAAVDQFRSLMKDIGAESVGEVPDKLQKAIEQAAVDQVQGKFEALRIAEQQGFKSAEVTEAGFFGDTKKTVFADPTTGALRETTEGFAKGGGAADPIQRIVAELTRAAQAAATTAPGGGLIRQPDLGGRGALIGPGEQPDPVAAAQAGAKALAGELKSAQLQTRITNVPELARALADKIPKRPPTPGPGER